VAELLLGVVVLCAAGLVQGCTGFGLALVAGPCLLLVFDQTLVVPVLLLLSTVNTSIVAWDARRHIQWALVLPLTVGGFVGFPVGVYTLKVVDPVMLKAGTGVFVTLAALTLLSGWRRPVRERVVSLAAVGTVGAFFGGSTAMGGPPVVLFLANQGTRKEVFRGSIACYFLLVNIYGMGWLLYQDLLTKQVFDHAGIFLPTMLVGTYAGLHLARRIREDVFRKAVLIGVGIVGIVLLVSQF
jgi:uncharacterized protein